MMNHQYGSVNPQIVVIDDLFSFPLSQSNIVIVFNHFKSMIEQTLSKPQLIENLYQCDSLTAFDYMLTLRTMFDVSELKLSDMSNGLYCKAYLDQVIRKPHNKKLHHGLEILYRQFVIALKRSIFDIIISSINQPMIIRIKTFDYHLLYQLNHHVKGWLIDQKKLNQTDVMMLDAFDLSYSATIADFKSIKNIQNQALKHMTIYLPLADLRMVNFIHQSYYQGIYFMSEYMMVAKGSIFTKEEAFIMFETLFKAAKQKPIVMTIPTFTDHLKLNSHPHLRTDVYEFSLMHDAVIEWLKGLQKAYHQYRPQLTVLISRISSKYNLTFWQQDIDILKTYLDENIRIGMTMETESALQYCEDFKSMGHVVFKLDELMEEYDEKDLMQSSFLKEDLRNAHYIYRTKQKKPHMLLGKALEKKCVLTKFINMGFRGFVIKPSEIARVMPVFQLWEKTRGKYTKKTD